MPDATRTSIRPVFLFLALLGVLLAAPAEAQEIKLTASDGERNHRFGSSVALSADGRLALIGTEVVNSRDQERAYIFVQQSDGSYTQETQLTASDGESGDRFGTAVALSADGQHALVGVTSTDFGSTDQGSAYVYGPASLPVELAGFHARADGRRVELTWTTLSETNNAGFEVLQQTEAGYENIHFAAGQGTTSEPHDYRHVVENLAPGTHTFRLKQIDLDGTETLSEERSVTLSMAEAFRMSAAYPNPMRHSAQVDLRVRTGQRVTVEVFNALGQRVQVLFEGEVAPGELHRLPLEGTGLPSGLYVVRAVGEDFTATRRVTVVR